jgi:acetyl-CoA carboxylase biotin carboxyl carrier protein
MALAKRSSKKKDGEAVSGAIQGSPMDLRLLDQIVKLMAANDLNTVEVRDGEKRITLKRGAAGLPMISTSVASAPAPAGSSVATAAPTDESAGYQQIKSPMVGTFYASSSPDAKPFVQVGSTVDEETDVCIIEAMKVFNNIKAETRGTIAKILVTNGQTVEFGQTLFLVKPA